MSKTLSEITNDVLRKLKRLPTGQVAPQNQKTIVEDAYDALYQELLGKALVNWSATDSIPDIAAYPIRVLLCARTADDFGVPDKWSAREREMKLMLSENLKSPYIHQPTTFENF